MNSLIAKKQKKNAYNYKVLYGRGGFKLGSVMKGGQRNRLTDNKDDPIYTIIFNSQEYVAKQVGKYGEDEWDIIIEMISHGKICPYMVDYYACIRSLSNHKNYILMKRANMDLKDYIRQYKIDISNTMALNLTEFALNINEWCMKYLGLVYTDLKCRNILVFFNSKHPENVDYRLTDIGLMEEYDDRYKPDWRMLTDKDIVNFMYPRRHCNYQQCALFAIAMFIVELVSIDLDVNTVIHPAEVPEGEAEKEKQEGTEEVTEEVTEGTEEMPEGKIEKEQGGEQGEKQGEETETETDATSDSRSDATSDTSSSFDSGESEDEEDQFVSVSSKLDGRKDDEQINLLFEHLPFFKKSENQKLKEYLLNLVNFKYSRLLEAKEAIKNFK